jgi:hypothetical protein
MLEMVAGPMHYLVTAVQLWVVGRSPAYSAPIR